MLFKKRFLLKAVLGTILAGAFTTSNVLANSVEASDKLDAYDFEGFIIEGTAYYGGMMGNTGYMGNMLNNKNIMDIPMETTSIGQEGIKTFAMPGNELYDALTISPAIRQSTSSVGLRGTYTTADSMSINGVSGMVGDTDMATNFLERVDILSGPNMVFSGSTSNTGTKSGGSIILQSKKAKLTPQNDLDIKYTSKGRFTEAIDVGRRFGDNNEWGIRINAMHRDGEGAINDAENNVKNVYINLDYVASKTNTNLLLGYEDRHKFGGSSYWRPQGSNSSTAFVPKAPDGSYNQLPHWAQKHTKNTIVVVNHNQKLNDNFSAFFNAGYRKTEVPLELGGSTNNPLIFNQNGSFSGDFKYTNIRTKATKTEKYYVGAGVRLNNEFKNIKNELVVGVDRSHHKDWSGKETKLINELIGNIYQNNYWDVPSYTVDRNMVLKNKRYVNSISAVDTMRLLDDKLIIMAGVHYHEYQPYGVSNGNAKKTDSFSQICPAFGVSYKINPNFMVYANHAEDFQTGKVVPSGKDYINEGELLDPDITKSNEIGFKYMDKKFLHTLSFFYMDDPSYAENEATKYYGKEGNDIYKGGVYSVAGSIDDNWDIFGGIGYARRIWDKNTDPIKQGRDTDGIPKWNGSLGAIYHADDNLDILGRLTYIGKADIYYGKLTVPSSTRVDLGLNYKTNWKDTPVTLTAMCYNIFDNNYWLTANQGNHLKASDPRTFMLSAHFEI